MKSRMDKYYKEEELMQRTSKNDSLYDELYREKQIPRSNVTVLDNINEIDITKIKAIVDKREGYKKVRDYEKIISPISSYKKSDIDYEFDEIDYSNYDINEILKKKRSDNVYKEEPLKIRRIDKEYTEEYVVNDEDIVSEEFTLQEKQLKDLFNTVSRTSVSEATDLFANLKENKENEVKEDEFYTGTTNFDNDDFGEDIKEKSGSVIFVIISIIAIMIAIGLIIYVKFYK